MASRMLVYHVEGRQQMQQGFVLWRMVYPLKIIHLVLFAEKYLNFIEETG